MKKYFLSVMGIIFCMNLSAQKHELGVTVGLPNIIGDIGKTNYLQPLQIIERPLRDIPFSAGILYRWNLNNRQSLRFSLAYNQVYFDDRNAREDYRAKRGIHDKNTIIEAASVFEYYFFDINNEQYFAISPYLFGGIAGFASNDRDYTLDYKQRTDPAGNPIAPTTPYDYVKYLKYKDKQNFNASIPFGLGVKMKFSYNWLLSLEVGIRYTFTDNLDYSNLKDDKFKVNIDPALNQSPYKESIEDDIKKEIGKRQTGNPNSNDWYVVTGFHLTYTFGRPPCNCQ